MMLFFQVWAGVFFFANKLLLLLSEYPTRLDVWRWRRGMAWGTYLLGIPAWLAICHHHRNWIAFFIEISCLPSVLLGIYVAVQGKEVTTPKWLDYLAIIGVIVGMLVSLIDFGGFTTMTQALEFLLVCGLLYGTYRLAKDQLDGYIGYLVMTAASATLMWVQSLYILVVVQIFEFVVVFWAYQLKRKKQL
jgi:hypothetical protein